jgi:hypothetical protein
MYWLQTLSLRQNISRAVLITYMQIEDKLDKILERIVRRIDDGLRENRAQAMRMFTFAMTFSAISMFGLGGKMFKLF